MREGIERTLAALPRETHFPPYRELLVDAGGNLWMRDDHWLVFDPRGYWLGTVALPRDFRPLEIGADYVLGVHYDSLQVERVLLYALDRRTRR